MARGQFWLRGGGKYLMSELARLACWFRFVRKARRMRVSFDWIPLMITRFCLRMIGFYCFCLGDWITPTFLCVVGIISWCCGKLVVGSVILPLGYMRISWVV